MSLPEKNLYGPIYNNKPSQSTVIPRTLTSPKSTSSEAVPVSRRNVRQSGVRVVEGGDVLLQNNLIYLTKKIFSSPT